MASRTVYSHKSAMYLEKNYKVDEKLTKQLVSSRLVVLLLLVGTLEWTSIFLFPRISSLSSCSILHGR